MTGPFWYVDHSAWRRTATALSRLVPLDLERPRLDAGTWQAVVSRAIASRVIIGPGPLRFAPSRTADGLPSNTVPYGPGDPLTPLIFVPLPTGAVVPVQTSDVAWGDLQPDDDRRLVAQDIVFTAALDATLALVDSDDYASDMFQKAVRTPQQIDVNRELLATVPDAPDAPANAAALEALINTAAELGAFTWPCTVRKVSVRTTGRGTLGVNVLLSEAVNDVETVSAGVRVRDLADTSTAGVLAKFAAWFGNEAWHQTVVFPTAEPLLVCPDA